MIIYIFSAQYIYISLCWCYPYHEKRVEQVR